jgi:tetratricopeptide (TPR) repeat protein
MQRRQYNRPAVALRRAPIAFAVLLAAGSPTVVAAPPSATSTAAFDELARAADGARAAGRLDEAAGLYRRALALRPRWAEGLWALGTMAYDEDRWAECRDVFRRLSVLDPKLAPAWALRGLCEFRLGGFTSARAHLARGLSLGMAPQEELGRVALYHQALLLVRDEQFDLAIAPLRTILQFQAASPELDLACGLVVLRRPLLPDAVRPSDLDFVREAGKAYCAHLARHPQDAVRRFQVLLAEHPRERYLHYACGLALAQQGSADALDQYRKEIELFPDDVLARVELGFGLLARGREAEAVAPGEEAARLAPGLFVTHLLLGRALAATGRLEQGIRELETAARMQPKIPETQLALARAYAQAGRRQDAERASTAFKTLDASRRGSPGPTPEAP